MIAKYTTPLNKPELKHFILNSPFKSNNKVKSLLKDEYNVDATNYFIDKYIPSIPTYNKKESTKFHYKTYSMPGGYIGDIFFSHSNKVAFLLLIEINTRFAYAYQLNNITTKEIINIDEFDDGPMIEREVDIETKKIKTTNSLKNAFDRFLIDIKGSISSLRFDGESGIKSDVFQNYLKENNIIFIQTLPKQHSSLSLIDRLSRTIRDMAYNMGVEIYDQSIMDIILNYYNLAPHKTLTKIFFSIDPNLKIKFPHGIAPIDVDDKLEQLYIKECYKYNLMIKSKYDVEIDLTNPVYCYLYEDKNKLSKTRTQLNSDLYMIVAKENNLYKLINTRTQELKYAPRYRIVIPDQKV